MVSRTGVTRRQWLTALSVVGLGRTYVREAAALGVDTQLASDGRSLEIEAWIDNWLKGPRTPDGVLRLSRFVEPIYFLTEAVGWKANPGQKLPNVTVPAGFVTDFASIPRPFFSLLRPDGDYVYAAIVHDYMYWMQNHPRAIADDIFRRGMEDFGVATGTITTIYGTVRAGGGLAWDANARLKKQGERRILKTFPTDPRTRWADWKKQPNVFR